MTDMDKLREATGALLDQMLAMFPPSDCASLLRHMATEIERGQTIADAIQEHVAATSGAYNSFH
jgi:hypothetical protein